MRRPASRGRAAHGGFTNRPLLCLGELQAKYRVWLQCYAPWACLGGYRGAASHLSYVGVVQCSVYFIQDKERGRFVAVDARDWQVMYNTTAGLIQSPHLN
ncbi:hypothetical protein FKM82_031206 [Ascaphus truei]